MKSGNILAVGYSQKAKYAFYAVEKGTAYHVERPLKSGTYFEYGNEQTFAISPELLDLTYCSNVEIDFSTKVTAVACGNFVPLPAQVAPVIAPTALLASFDTTSTVSLYQDVIIVRSGRSACMVANLVVEVCPYF
jgi:hypothetical protein